MTGLEGITLLPPMELMNCDTTNFAFPAQSRANGIVAALNSFIGPVATDITPEQLEDRTAAVMSLGLPNFADMRALYPGCQALICGSGPSLDVEYVRRRQAEGARIFALNTVHDILIKAGVIPDFGVMIDPNYRVSGYMTPNRRVTYILGTSVDISVWRRFIGAGVKPFFFMPLMEEKQPERMTQRFPDHDLVIIAGITTVGGRCINVATWMGFEDQELHAFDSCYAPGKDGSDKTGLYAVDKPSTYHDARSVTITAKGSGDKFTCITNGAMARQIKGFYAILQMLPTASVNGGEKGTVGRVRLKVSGDGAIAWMAWKDGGADKYVEHIHPDVMAAKYGDAKHWDYFKGEPIDA